MSENDIALTGVGKTPAAQVGTAVAAVAASPVTAAAPQVATTAVAGAARQDVTERCQAAFRAGWHALELYVTAGGDEPIANFVLNWPPASRQDAKQLLDADIAQWTGQPAPAQAQPQLTGTGSSGALTPHDVAAFMVALAGQLLVSDYRLGNAFVIGVQLASLSRDGTATFAWLRAGEPDASRRTQLLPAVSSLAGSIRDLKSCFQPYAADAVATTLLDWNQYAFARSGDTSTAPDAAAQLEAQGRVWRALLSGQKLAQDQIHLADYLDGISRLANSVVSSARLVLTGTLGIVVGSILFVTLGGLVVALIYGKTGGVYAAGLSALAAVGISGSTVTAAATKALNTVGDSLWQAELGYAIADATSQLPSDLIAAGDGVSHVQRLKHRPKAGSRKQGQARTPRQSHAARAS